MNYDQATSSNESNWAPKDIEGWLRSIAINAVKAAQDPVGRTGEDFSMNDAVVIEQIYQLLHLERREDIVPTTRGAAVTPTRASVSKKVSSVREAILASATMAERAKRDTDEKRQYLTEPQQTADVLA